MSQTTDPVAIASGTPFSIRPPSSSPYAFVVITNLSPFLLLLQVQANSIWQAPFSEERYQIGATATPVAITPSTPAGATIPAGAGAQVQATWYEPGEPIIGTWPYSLTSSVQASTVLGNVTVTNFPAIQAVSGTVAISGTVAVRNAVVAAPGTGQTVVAAGPTSTQLGNIACTQGVTVHAKTTNLGSIFIGNSAVTTGNGLELPPSVAAPAIVIPVDNANRLYIIGTAGEGVTYLGI